MADVREFARHVELDVLVGVADARMQRGEMLPDGGFVAALFFQLALHRHERILTRLDLARGQLDEMPPQRIAELALE